MIKLYTFCSNCKQELISEIIDSEILITPCNNCSFVSDYLVVPDLECFKSVLICQHYLLKHSSLTDWDYGNMSALVSTIAHKFGYSDWTDAYTALIERK